MQPTTFTRHQITALQNWDCVTWELYATTACNLKCAYCYNADKPFQSSEPLYTVPELLQFFNTYAKKGDCLSFTGGEPLVRREWVADVVEKTASLGFEYEIYTNGTLLNTLKTDVLNQFKNIIVSIDGGRRQNDAVRGAGVYAKILDTISLIRPFFTGELIARITVTADNPLDQSVQSLLELKLFDVIYWQFQNTWELNRFPLQTKLQELDRLITFWIEGLKQGRVYRLQPFIAIVVRLLDQVNEQSYHTNHDTLPACTLGCGAGHHYFQIFITGDLYTCPEMVMNPDHWIGHIRTGVERRIQLDDFSHTHKCRICHEFPICHCRCLHCTPDQYCVLIKHTITRLRNELPLIKRLIDTTIIAKTYLYVKERLEEMF